MAYKAKRSVLEFFPYQESIRPQQKEVLLALEKYWDKYEVFCIVAPTACGKSSLARAISAWRYNSAVITPTNLLVQQYVDEFPNMQKLFKREFYKCPRFANGQLSCEQANKKYGRKKLGCSLDCAYLTDNRRVRGRGNFVANYYVYMANKLFKPTLIIDECQNVTKLVQDLCSKKLWRHDYHYPWDMWTHSDILAWLEGKDLDENEMLTTLKEEVKSSHPRFIIKRGYDVWNATNPPEERELLSLLPVDVKDAPPFLWPSQVQKIVMMSATISHKDLENLGLDRRRTLFLEVDSPIAATSRPIITDYVGAVNRSSIKELTLKMAEKIVQEYLPKYEGKKGMIHATYAQAKIFKEVLGNNARFIFHDRTNTRQKYQEFLDAPVESGVIFVASGLYEGVDLADDYGRFQIITKIPWLNLGDPAIKYKADQDESWFVWEAGKSTMQACGRICRNIRDFGETIIMDSSFTRLVQKMNQYNLIPQWWRDALPETLKANGENK